jgi:hypothetical protein
MEAPAPPLGSQPANPALASQPAQAAIPSSGPNASPLDLFPQVTLPPPSIPHRSMHMITLLLLVGFGSGV